MISKFINTNLSMFQEKFQNNIDKNGIEDALNDMLTELNIENNDRDLAQAITDKFNVSREDGVFMARQISEICLDKVDDIQSIRIEDAASMIHTLRNTDIPTPEKKELCEILLKDAIQTGDKEMFELVCIKSDGMSISDYEAWQKDIVDWFGEDEAKRAEILIKAKEEPEQTIENLKNAALNGEISVPEYVEMLAVLSTELKEGYARKTDIQLSLSVKENGELEFHAESGDRIPENASNIPIGEDKDKELSIEKEEAVKVIQKHQIRSDTVLDCVCEVNLPPDNPNFTSELAQKFANYTSSLSLSQGDTDKEKHILSSIVPDDQKASFDRMVDDCMNEQHNEQHENLQEEIDSVGDGIIGDISVEDFENIAVEDIEGFEEAVEEEMEEEYEMY